MADGLQPFEVTFGELRSLISVRPDNHWAAQNQLGKILTLIWPWRDDARYAEQLVPYVLNALGSWDEYINVPDRRWSYTKPYQSPLLLSIRDAYLRGESDPLWPLFNRLRVHFSELGAEVNYADEEGDQHAIQGVVCLPDNSALLTLDIECMTTHSDDVIIESLHNLLSSPTLAKLDDIRWTNIIDEPVIGEAFVTLCKNPVVTQIERLEFYDVPVGVEGVKHLVAAKHWEKLKYIFFTSYEVERGCDIDDEAFEILARSPLFAQLEVLDVSWNGEITIQSAHMLVEHVDPKTAPIIDFDCTSFKWDEGEDFLWDAGWHHDEEE